MPRSAQIAAALTVRGSSQLPAALRVASFTRQLGQLMAERRRETTATLGSGGQRLDPLSVNVVRDVF